MGLAYLATPYSKYPLGIEQAYIDASNLAARLLLAGINAYSPIAHSHSLAIYGDIDPHNHNIWLPFDKTIMRVCDTLLFAQMNGWQDSYGMRMELEFFQRQQKPIFDLNPKTLTAVRR